MTKTGWLDEWLRWMIRMGSFGIIIRKGAVIDGYSRKKEAIGGFRMLLAISPDYALAHNDLGKTFTGSGLTVRGQDKIEDPKPRKKCWFCHINASLPPIFRLEMTKSGASPMNTSVKWSSRKGHFGQGQRRALSFKPVITPMPCGHNKK